MPKIISNLLNWLLLGTVLLFGIGGSYGLWVFNVAASQELSQTRFDADTSYEFAVIQSYMTRIIDVVDDFAILQQEMIRKGEGMSASEFERLAQRMLDRELAIQAFAWNPVVSDEERQVFEATARREDPSFRFTETGGEGEIITAPERDWYVVVQYIHPPEGNRAAVGYDTAGEPRRRDAIERSRTSRKPAATAPIRLVQETQDQRSILVFAPCWGADHQAPIGYIVAVVRLDDAMNMVLPAEHAAKRGVHVRDIDAPEEDQLLFRVDPPEVTQAVQSRTKNVTVAGRSWQIHFSPGPDYAPDLQTPRVLAGAGCLATVIILIWLGNVTRHNAALKREVNQRTIAEAALAASEERLRLTVDSSSSGSWDWNFNTMHLLLSDEYLRWIGYEPGEIEHDAKAIQKLVHPDDQTRITEALWTHIRTPGSVFACNHRIVCKNGEYRVHESRGRVVTWNSDGSAARFVGLSEDVTEKHAEQERHVRLEEKLRDAQKLESLGMMAAGIAHDFNNLLVGVVLTADLALEECRDPDTKELLELILESGNRASELTHEMLTYAGRGEIVLTPVDANRIVVEMRAILESSIGRRHQLTIECCDSPLVFEGDATQLRQIVLNLVTNAADAMGDAAGHIVIRLGPVENSATQHAAVDLAPGEYLCLEVVDNGCGMDEETQRRAFDPFFSTKALGRGLGLASVIGIVRRHRGILNIVSSPGGGGTSMKVFIPLLGRQGPTETEPLA